MEENYFKVPFYIINLKEHSEIKSNLKEYLDRAEFQSTDEIYKTDFYLKDRKEYHSFIIPYLLKNLKSIFGESKIKILDCWFQQYRKYSHHPFHSHDCQWAAVYYLELPPGSSGTVFKNYLSNEEIKPSVKEGDIIIFPGWIRHKSPANKGQEVKSIIAINFEVID